jgi:hypothetical protein
MESLLNCWNVLIWNIASLSGILELATEISTLLSDTSLIEWLHISNHASILTGTSTLFLVQEIECLLGRNSLSIVYGWVTNNQVNVIFSLHSLAVDKEMQLSHSRNNDLLTLFILLDDKGGVFSLEARQCLQESVQ